MGYCEKHLKKTEDPAGYAKLANEGILLGYPVKMNGQTHRPDNNIMYHATLKEFNKEKDHVHDIHNLAQHLPLNAPDAKNTQIKPEQFKDREGNDVYVISLFGNSAEKMKEYAGKFAHMGHPSEREWHPHISVDKATHDKIKASGAKTAHEAGISFDSAVLKKGPQTLKTYHHQADSAEPTVPDHGDFTSKVKAPITKAEDITAQKPLMKPYLSEAQRRWAHTPSGLEALGGKAGVHEWDEATKGKKLPERVAKAEEPPKPAEAPDEHHITDEEMKNERVRPFDPKEHHGKKVFVYRNLHNNLWSVRHKGKVLGHAEHVGIDNPEFKVSQAGRDRVLKEKRKNVHAGVSGTLNAHAGHEIEGKKPVSYNPYKAGHFFDVADQSPVHHADHATMRIEDATDATGKKSKAGRVYASNPTTIKKSEQEMKSLIKSDHSLHSQFIKALSLTGDIFQFYIEDNKVLKEALKRK